MKNKKHLNSKKQDLSEKILLHLADSVDFGFSCLFNKRLGLPKFPGKIFRDLIEKDFRDSVAELKKSRFIERKNDYDGSIMISLTERGRLRALNLRFKKLSNREEEWDGKFRMIAFDIPEEFRKGRSALRYRARMAGFYELQESLFLYPYDCKKEIEDFIELFKLEKYVRFATVDFIDNQDKVKSFFKLK